LSNNPGSVILRNDYCEYIPGINFVAVVLNKEQVISNCTELRGEHTGIFQNHRLQPASGNTIQGVIDVNNDFNTLDRFIVRANTAGCANAKRVDQGSPP
jgi:hypothetical protein